MTPTEQIKAIAELDGLISPFACVVDNECYIDCLEAYNEQVEKLPNYLTSYDAIIPVIQRLSYCGLLSHRGCSLQSTPAQLCEALLRATGKWIT